MQYVYILKSLSREDKTYVGCTNDLKRRLRDHNGGECKFTSQYIPWKIVYFEEVSRGMAVIREKQIKKWSREKKEALIKGEMGRLKELARRRL